MNELTKSDKKEILEAFKVSLDSELLESERKIFTKGLKALGLTLAEYIASAMPFVVIGDDSSIKLVDDIENSAFGKRLSEIYDQKSKKELKQIDEFMSIQSKIVLSQIYTAKEIEGVVVAYHLARSLSELFGDLIDNQKIDDSESIALYNRFKNMVESFKKEAKLTMSVDELRSNNILIVDGVIHLYWWTYEIERLDSLYGLLLDGDYIEPNDKFMESFRFEIVNTKHRIVWKRDNMKLFALLYLIYSHNITFAGYDLVQIVKNLFILKPDIKNGDSLGVAASRIRKKHSENNLNAYLNKNHRDIIDIISEIGLLNKA